MASEAILRTEQVFVGRDAELSGLHEAARRAANGHCELVFVEGEEGVGKTALVNAWIGHEELGTRLGTGRCVEGGRADEPYLPVLQAMEQLMGGSRGLPVLRQYAPTWLAQMPWLVDADQREEWSGELGYTSRPRMLREAARALEAWSDAELSVLILEDLHWCDEETLGFLTSIPSLIATARLMIVATYRRSVAAIGDLPVHTEAERMQVKGEGLRIVLEPFCTEDVRRYCSARLESTLLPEDFADRVHAHTAGLPLFVRATIDELMRTNGSVAENRGGNRVEPSATEKLAQVPDDVSTTIRLQLLRLSEPERRLLEVASLAGMEFEPPVLAAGLGEDTGEHVERIEAMLHQMVERWPAITSLGDDTWPDGTPVSRYAFRHALYRKVAGSRLGAARRANMHRRIGERLKRAYGADTRRIAARLAHHFAEAADDSQASRYFGVAVEVASDRGSDPTAIDLWKAALLHLARVPLASPIEEAFMRASLGVAQVRSCGVGSPDDEANLTRVQLLSAKLADSPGTFVSLMSVWRLQLSAGRIDDAHALEARLGGIAEQDGNRVLLFEARYASATTASYQGQFERSAAALDDAHRLNQEQTGEDREAAAALGLVQRDPELRLLMVAGPNLWFRGFRDESMRVRERLKAMLQVRRRTYSDAGSWNGIVTRLLEEPEPDYAQALSENAQGLALAEEYGVKSVLTALKIQRARILAMTGDAEESARLLDESEETCRTHVRSLAYLSSCRDFAIASAERGTFNSALSMVEEALAFATAMGFRMFDSSLWYIRGDLLRRRGAPTDGRAAAECYEKALTVARNQGNVPGTSAAEARLRD